MDAKQPSQLETLRDDIADLLRPVPALAGVDVFTRKTGDIENAIQSALTKAGISLEVVNKSASIIADSDDGVVVMEAVITVIAYEEVLINRDPQNGTGKTAMFLIEQATVALKMTRPASAAGVLEPDERGPQQGKIAASSTGFVVTQDFTTKLQIVPVNA